MSLSPLPVLAEVLSMTESGRVRAAVALAIGYASALAVIAAAAVLLGSKLDSTSTTSKGTAIIDLVAGVLLVVVAIRMKAKARSNPDAGLPGWIQRVGSMGIVFAFCLGAFLPPYVVAVAAGNEIVREGLSSGIPWWQAVVFVICASIGVTTPIVIVLLSPGSPEERLASWKSWLEHNWQIVASWIVLVAGVYLAIKGGIELAKAT